MYQVIPYSQQIFRNKYVVHKQRIGQIDYVGKMEHYAAVQKTEDAL